MRAAPILFPAIWHLAVVTCLFNAVETSHPPAGSLAGRNQSQTSICLLSARKIYHGPAVICAASEYLLRVPGHSEGVIFSLGGGPVV